LKSLTKLRLSPSSTNSPLLWQGKKEKKIFTTNNRLLTLIEKLDQLKMTLSSPPITR